MKLLSKKRIKEIKSGDVIGSEELDILCRMSEAHRADQWRKRIKKRLNRRANKKKQYLKSTDKLDKYQIAKIIHYVTDKANQIRETTENLYEPIENECMVITMLETGIRVEEICNLKIKCLPVYHGHNEIDVLNGKGQKDRTIGISDWFRCFIDEYCMRYHKKTAIGRYLFTSRINRPMTTRAIWGRVKTIGRDCGIWLYKRNGQIKSRLSPHKFRHTHATFLLDACDNEFLVQDQLGHSKLDTTHIYAKTLYLKRSLGLNGMHNGSFKVVRDDISKKYNTNGKKMEVNQPFDSK